MSEGSWPDWRKVESFLTTNSTAMDERGSGGNRQKETVLEPDEMTDAQNYLKSMLTLMCPDKMQNVADFNTVKHLI